LSEFQPPTLRQRAGAVADLAREHAAQTEKLRQLHPEVLRAMQDMGLPQLIKHGSMCSIREFVDVCGILGEGCMSTGWCNFVWGVHNYLVGLFPQETQDEVWSNPKTLISASLGPVGQTDGVTEDGAVISGRWRFNSGCDHADWLLLGVSQPEGEPYLALVHKSEYQIDDTWQVLGLRGTGSKDAIVDNVRIPPERLMPASMTLYPYGALLVLVIVGPVIGGAQAAVNEFSRKIGPDAEQGLLLRLAESSAEVDAARTVALAAADILDINPAPAAFMTTRILRDTAFAARLCNQATRRLFEAAGGSELHDSRPLQRIFRDMTAACAHARLQWEGQVLPYANMLVAE
jgi:alkylation response protein AidB-like acyl-CoA dehydrogenase